MEKDEHKILNNAKEIKAFMEKMRVPKIPMITTKNPEESKMRRRLDYIKRHIVEPYEACTSDSTKEKIHQMYPDLDEIFAIMKWIDEKNCEAEEMEKQYIFEVKRKYKYKTSKIDYLRKGKRNLSVDEKK